MAVAAGDLPRARSVYSTALALITGIGLTGSCITFLASPLVPWEKFLSVPFARHGELVTAANCLGLAVFVSFFVDTFYGRFQAARRAHQAVWLNGGRPWIEFAAMFTALQFSPRLDVLAAAMLSSSIAFLSLYQWLSRRSLPEITFALNDVQKGKFAQLFRKGIAFQAFPFGNALLFQGNLLIVQYFLGPVAVTIFATARTLSRSVSQSMELVNQAIWPELSRLLSTGDLLRASRLHRIAILVSGMMALSSVTVLATFGHSLYGWWTGRAIDMPHYLLLIFLLPIPLNVLWFTSSVVHAACNQHEGLAIRYMIATCLASIACATLAYSWGLEGAAISSLAVDLLLIPYVLKRSLALTGESWQTFALGLKHEVETTTKRIGLYLQSRKDKMRCVD